MIALRTLVTFKKRWDEQRGTSPPPSHHREIILSLLTQGIYKRYMVGYGRKRLFHRATEAHPKKNPLAMDLMSSLP